MVKRTQPPETQRASSGRLVSTTPEDMAEKRRRIIRAEEMFKSGRRFVGLGESVAVMLAGDEVRVINPFSGFKESAARSEPDYAAELTALIQRLDVESRALDLKIDTLLSRLRTTRIVA